MMALAARLRRSTVRACSAGNRYALGSCNGTVVRLALISNSSDSGETVAQEQLAGTSVKIKAKEKRFQRHELLRQNRCNPVLEKEARTGRCTYV